MNPLVNTHHCISVIIFVSLDCSFLLLELKEGCIFPSPLLFHLTLTTLLEALILPEGRRLHLLWGVRVGSHTGQHWLTAAPGGRWVRLEGHGERLWEKINRAVWGLLCTREVHFILSGISTQRWNSVCWKCVCLHVLKTCYVPFQLTYNFQGWVLLFLFYESGKWNIDRLISLRFSNLAKLYR